MVLNGLLVLVQLQVGVSHAAVEVGYQGLPVLDAIISPRLHLVQRLLRLLQAQLVFAIGLS